MSNRPRRRIHRICALLMGGLLLAPASGAPSQQPAASAPDCRPDGPLVRVPELPEASGLAVSRLTASRLWAHNDSGEPQLVALNAQGKVTGRMRVSGAKVEDWEAIAVGPCPAGSCIYVGDIGDNEAKRDRVTIYRISESKGTSDAPDTAEAFHATYPDGAHDAETLLVSPEGRLFIVTKGDTGPVALYAFPRELRAGATSRLERIGQPRESGKPSQANRITDGSVSPDGRWVALRTNTTLTLYPASDLLSGQWRPARRVELKALGEPQGEGVAYGAGGVVYVAGEGGGKSQPGTFGRLACGG
jgi:hypothetical protein